MTSHTTPAGARTAGPWDYFVGNANGRGLIRIEAGIDSPEAGKHIASMPRGAESEANAAILCQAVNDRADLIAALKEIETICTESTGDCRRRMGTRVGNVLVAARAAIAKTGGA